MPKPTKPNSDLVAELTNIEAKLRYREDEICALKKELSAAKKVADSDRALLANGLRLALANEALRVEVAALRKRAAKAAADEKAVEAST
jgi:hypothetical protein